MTALARCSTEWEYFRSEWHKRAIARDASQYRDELVRRLKALASETEGGNSLVAALRDVGLDVEINLRKNPTIATINKLRHSADQNIAFPHQKEADRDANRDLVPLYAAKATSLSREDWLVIELMIAIRNAVAHSSSRSIDVMNAALTNAAKVKKSADIRNLAMTTRRVPASGIGRYLCAKVSWGGAQGSRVVAICTYIRGLGDRFRI